MNCPICNQDELTEEFYEKKINFHCPNCRGRLMTVPGLRSLSGDRKFVDMLWQTAKYGYSETGIVCPSCKKNMRKVTLPLCGAGIELDLCCSCQLIWFDPSELERIPLPTPEKQKELPEKVRELLALRQAEAEEDRLNTELKGSPADRDAPDGIWKYIPALLGMPVEENAPAVVRKPVITWSLVVLCLAVFALTFSNLSEVIKDWGFIPAQWERHSGLTMITSMFLHGGIIHLLGNLYFLVMFGDNVEDEFGHVKYILLVISSGLCALALHTFFDPRPEIPCVGASGFISGIIASYAICFPKARLSFMIFPRNFIMSLMMGRFWFAIPAWAAFGLWIIFQIVMAKGTQASGGGVAYMAHIGGVLAGIMFAVYYRISQKKEYDDWARRLEDFDKPHH